MKKRVNMAAVPVTVEQQLYRPYNEVQQKKVLSEGAFVAQYVTILLGFLVCG